MSAPSGASEGTRGRRARGARWPGRWAWALLLAAPTALAVPPDWTHDVEPGREKFVKLPRLDWVEVEDPSVATAEWLGDANELLLSGLKPGRTLLLPAQPAAGAPAHPNRCPAAESPRLRTR